MKWRSKVLYELQLCATIWLSVATFMPTWNNPKVMANEFSSWLNQTFTLRWSYENLRTSFVLFCIGWMIEVPLSLRAKSSRLQDLIDWKKKRHDSLQLIRIQFMIVSNRLLQSPTWVSSMYWKEYPSSVSADPSADLRAKRYNIALSKLATVNVMVNVMFIEITYNSRLLKSHRCY